MVHSNSVHRENLPTVNLGFFLHQTGRIHPEGVVYMVAYDPFLQFRMTHQTSLLSMVEGGMGTTHLLTSLQRVAGGGRSMQKNIVCDDSVPSCTAGGVSPILLPFCSIPANAHDTHKAETTDLHGTSPYWR